jgi:hypothetical protein
MPQEQGESAARVSESISAEVFARLMLHDCFPFPGCPLVNVEVIDPEVAELLARAFAQG